MNLRAFVLTFITCVAAWLSCSGQSVHRWGVFEKQLINEAPVTHPLWDARLKVRLTAPSGEVREVEGFWYDDNQWRFRVSPDQPGRWQWVAEWEPKTTEQSHGEFTCSDYSGSNPLYRHGPVELAPSQTYLQQADGTPFFWLADTAWNGLLLSTEKDWEHYLETRADQRFTVIQCVTTQWRGARTNLASPMYYTNQNKLTVNPDLCRQIDARIDRINAHGLLAAPVMLWALTPQDPGQALSELDAIRLARYIRARWGAYQLAWLLGGDGRYENKAAPRWRAIGRAVFPGEKDRLVTLHSAGSSWILQDFLDEAWLDFIGYQSSHSGSEKVLRWLTGGPPATDWKLTPTRPFMNLEPNYELHSEKGSFTDYHVRRAAYWSMMVAPTAGVAYGNTPVWAWNRSKGPAEGHERLGNIDPWRAGLKTPGIRSMTLLREFFESGPWHDLVPAPELLAEQPGKQDIDRFVSISKTKKGWWAVAYIPAGDPIRLQGLQPGLEARWFDPRTGRFSQAGSIAGTTASFTPPDKSDWLLDVR